MVTTGAQRQTAHTGSLHHQPTLSRRNETVVVFVPNSMEKPTLAAPIGATWKRGRGIEIGVLAGILVYFVIYLGSEPIRGFALLRLLVPDDLLLEWSGNDTSRIGLLDRVPILFEVAALQGLALIAGRRLLIGIGADRGLDRLEQAVFSLGIGLNVWSLYTLTVGLLGQLQQPLFFWIPAVGLTALAAWDGYTWWRTGVASGASSQPMPTDSVWRRPARLERSNLPARPSRANRHPTRHENPSTSRSTIRQEEGQVRSSRRSGTGQEATFAEQLARPTWPRWLGRLLILLCIPFCLLLIFEGMLPPWHFDAREYHLQVPKEWYQAGTATFMPHNVYGNMPLGAEMQVILGIVFWPGSDAWWWGALAGKTSIAAMAIWTAVALFAAGRRFFGPWVGQIAAFAYITTPWVIHVSVSGLIDGVAALYSLLTCYALGLWCGSTAIEQGRADQTSSAAKIDDPPAHPQSSLNSPTPTTRPGVRLADSPASIASESNDASAAGSRVVAYASSELDSGSGVVGQDRRVGPESGRASGTLILAGFLAGSAVSCKYPAVLFLVIPALVFVTLQSRKNFRWQAITLFLLAVLAGCGLWFGKNAVLTANPTYPLLYDLFGGTSLTAEKAQQWSQAHQTPRSGSGWALTGTDFFKSMRLLTLESDFLSPLIWPLALLGCAAAYRDRRVALLIGLILFTILCWWTLTHRVDRFLLPILPQACLLVGIGVHFSNSRLWRASIIGFLLLACLINGLLAASRFSADNRMLVRLSDLRTDLSHASDRGWTRVHPIIRYLNEHVRPGDRVLLVGEAQVFDLEVPAIYNTCFDDCVFEQRFRNRSLEARRAALKAERITYIFVNWRELDRYREPGNYGYSDYVTRARVRDELVRQQGLLRRVELDIDPENSELFEVVEQQGS